MASKRKKKPVRKSPPMRKRLAFLDVETHSLKDVKLKPKIRAVVEVETGELIALICKAASERWPEDLSRPGIQIAHLPGTEAKCFRPEALPAFYVALHRYEGLHGDGRIVAFKTTADDLDKALREVALYVATPTPMRAQLAKVIK